MDSIGWLQQWLSKHGLGKYVSTFAEQEIGRDVLSKLTEQDFKDLGLPLGDRKRLMDAIQSLQHASPDEPPAAASGQAERRQLTILFCDLVGSTALSQQLDPEALRELMKQYQQACRGVIERYEGHVAQYLGDGLMVYFGFPRAHEDDAERAVRSALEIVGAVSQICIADTPSSPALLREGGSGSKLQVRIGVATGPVVVGETGAGDASVPKLAVGETPNLAARLQGLAGPDQIVIGPSTHRLLGSAFELKDLGPQALKGILEPVHAKQVIRLAQVEGRFEASRGKDLTPLVGRDTEVTLLLDRWQQAKDGEGQVALLSGEGGIGKSRITRALIERTAHEPQRRMRLQCSPYHRNSSLYPVIGHLEFAAGFGRNDTADEKLDKLEAMLGEGKHANSVTTTLLASLLSLPTARHAPLNLSPEKQKEKTLDGLIDLVLAAAREQPVLMIVEDVHWIDPTTQELLDLTLPRISGSQVLLLLTFRPEYVSHWGAQAHVTTLTLNRLSKRQGNALIAQITAGKPFPPEVRDLILAKTDGVPLFVEELTKAVREGNYLKDAGDHYELIGALPALAIPSSLQDSLMARLDRLALVKDVAQIGACIGRDFSYDLVAAVSPLDDAALRDALRQLVDSELIFVRGVPPNATYTFKHALVQDAAYCSLLKSRRTQFHSSIAGRLESHFPELAANQPEILAHHFTEAGLTKRAIEYWLKAGQRSARRLAYKEAIAYFRRGIELAASHPAPQEVSGLELQCQIGLGYGFIPLEGWTAPESLQAFSRAQVLCEDNSDNEAKFSALSGLALFHMVRAEVKLSMDFADKCVTVAKDSASSDLLVQAHSTRGTCALRLGEFDLARTEIQEVARLYNAETHGNHAFKFGQDPLVLSTNWLAITTWALGYPDYALACCARAKAAAQNIMHPVTQGFALHALALTHLLRREPEAALQASEALVALGTEQGLPFWIAIATAYRAVALIGLGRGGQQELTQAQDIIAAIEGLGALEASLRVYTVLIEAYLHMKKFDAALEAAEKVLGRVRHHCLGEFEAPLSRMMADALVSRTNTENARAESLYLESIEIACRQGAKSHELRAATHLARFWQSHGKRSDARRLLAPVYSWFTEGSDTPNLIEAKALLDELA